MLLVVCLGLAATACGGEEEPELTVEERLELIEGRPLTAVQVTDLLNVASALCALDEPVLDAVWQRLSDEQLEFQDFVFSQTCPERSVFYAGMTGRFVTDEAVESGVVTSTTRPASTTIASTAVPSPTTIAPPASSDTDGTAGDDPASDPDSADDPGDDTDMTEVTPPPGDSTETTPPEGEGG